jgi:type VI secretion system protein ImpF
VIVAELTPQERLQPALLDRLADDEVDKKQEPREARVIKKAKLRQAVLRDLAWLFNSVQLGGDVDWASNPAARHSVINFGLPALSGETASTLDVRKLEEHIRQAILDFEPRIGASSLRVEAVVSEMQLDHHNVVSVQIRGDLWAQPVPLEVLLRTDVDLETGEVRILDIQ